MGLDADAPGDSPEHNRLVLNPWAVRLIGRDPPLGGEVSDVRRDPAYARSVHAEPLPSLVMSIAATGVVEPVIAESRGRLSTGAADVVILDGRERVKAARVADELSRAAGGSGVSLPVVLRPATTAAPAIAPLRRGVRRMRTREFVEAFAVALAAQGEVSASRALAVVLGERPGHGPGWRRLRDALAVAEGERWKR